MNRLWFLVIWIISPIAGLSNNLQITSLSRDSLAQTVTFEISWENSWRVDSVGQPANWDAVWVFVKFQPCETAVFSDWKHGVISPVLADHDFGQLESVLSDGSGIGIDPVPYNHGVMLRRPINGLFSAAGPSQVTLKVDNMLPTEAYNIRIIGVEMVFVPQGAYELGALTYSNAFASATAYTNSTPVIISSEASQTIYSHAPGTNNTVILPAAFPKGVDAFHVMKYEITAEHYATFLNTLSPAVQYSRFPGNVSLSRNSLQAGGAQPNQFFTNRPTRAQNYLGWDDIAAFLDWAALRPMTEMEYEKTCRGQDTSFVGQFPWGTNSLFLMTDITSPEDGTEISANQPANVHAGNPILVGGDKGRGPIRIGVFAQPNSLTREETGAGYYGCLDLAGNIAEACVQVSVATSTTGTVAFTSAPGDGTLSAAGAANEAGWPAASSTAAILRGGGFNHPATPYLYISDRTLLNWPGTRDQSSGGRGVRN